MNPELMEALQVLKFSIRNGCSLHFTEDMDWDEDLKEMEREALVNQHVENI
jgi:hypothetical protein